MPSGVNYVYKLYLMGLDECAEARFRAVLRLENQAKRRGRKLWRQDCQRKHLLRVGNQHDGFHTLGERVVSV